MLLIVIQLSGLVSTYTYDGLDRRVNVAVELPEAKLAGFKPDPFGEERVPRELREELGEAYAELLATPELKTEYEYVHDLTAPYNDPLMVYGRHNASVQRYTHGLEVLAMDTWKNIAGNLQNQTPAGAPPKHERSYFLQNNLGSPMRLLGEGGETKAYYSYDAFGKPVLAVTAGSREGRQRNIFSYTGYQYDVATGLHFAQARYYMPEVGRFVSEDPVAGWGPNPLTLNLYLFNLNNPFKYKDPDGLTPKVSNPTTKAVNNASGGCSATGLGDATTSPWLNDPRTGVRLHLEEFRNGGSFLTTRKSYNTFIRNADLIGYDDNTMYIARKDFLDKVIKEANGDVSILEGRLGFKPGHFAKGGGMVRVDIKNPLLHNIRMPSGLEKGANEYYNSSGYTSGLTREERKSKVMPMKSVTRNSPSGGVPEAVIDQVLNTDEYRTITFFD